MWEKEYGKSGHLSIFTRLKHLMMLLKYNFFQGFIFTPYQRHWYHVGPCSSDFFEVETLLNIAFNFFSSNYKVLRRAFRMGATTYSLNAVEWKSTLFIVILGITSFGVESTPNYSGIHSKAAVWITLLRVDSTILSVDFHSRTKWSLIWLLYNTVDFHSCTFRQYKKPPWNHFIMRVLTTGRK